MHSFGKEFLVAFIAKTVKKIYQRERFLRKFTLEVALGWKPLSCEELLIFFVQTITKGLIIKRSIKDF